MKNYLSYTQNRLIVGLGLIGGFVLAFAFIAAQDYQAQKAAQHFAYQQSMENAYPRFRQTQRMTSRRIGMLQIALPREDSTVCAAMLNTYHDLHQGLELDCNRKDFGIVAYGTSGPDMRGNMDPYQIGLVRIQQFKPIYYSGIHSAILGVLSMDPGYVCTLERDTQSGDMSLSCVINGKHELVASTKSGENHTAGVVTLLSGDNHS